MYIIFKTTTTTTTKTRDCMIQNVNNSTNNKIAVSSVRKRKPKIDLQEIWPKWYTYEILNREQVYYQVIFSPRLLGSKTLVQNWTSNTSVISWYIQNYSQHYKIGHQSRKRNEVSNLSLSLSLSQMQSALNRHMTYMESQAKMQHCATEWWSKKKKRDIKHLSLSPSEL